MNKIFITGNTCTGKSRLANSISKLIQIPVTNLDDIFWKNGFNNPILVKNFKEEVKDITRKNQWIIEGIYTIDVGEIISQDVDLIIFLDIPYLTCVKRIFFRSICRIINKNCKLESIQTVFFNKKSLLYKIIFNWKATNMVFYNFIKKNSKIKIITIRNQLDIANLLETLRKKS